MTDYIVANCETAEFNGLYEYDVWFGFNDESNMVWIKWDGNGHEVENVIAIIASNLTEHGQPYIEGVSVSDRYANQDTNNQSLTYPDDPSIVWMIGGSDSGDYSNLTVTAASSSQNLTSQSVTSASSVSSPVLAEFLSGTVDETYVLSAQYFGKFYWPNNAVPEVAADFLFAEIWDGSVVMNLVVAGNVVLNKEINEGVIMNQEITDTYSELEAI